MLRPLLRRLPLLGLLAALPGVAVAQDAGWTACRAAIAAAKPASGLPPGLLLAIALVEADRHDQRIGRVEPWPWSWNSGGEGRAAPTRDAAVAKVSALLARGVRSIDIGCMQVNLLHHPSAFGGVAEGFDPPTNIRYAIGFLRELRARTGDWAQAIAHFHSGEAERGLAYHRRVVLARLGAAWMAGGAVPLPLRAAGGLCAPGRIPALVIRPAAARQGSAARPRIACQRAGAAR